jgi:hypothetical protein
MKKLIAVWGITMAGILAASLWYLYGPGTVPEGQSPLVAVDANDLNRLQNDFNLAADRVRILLIVSPTRPESLEAASTLQGLLTEFDQSAILAQIVWEPQVESDWAPPATEVMARIWDLRAKQYWDKRRLVSGQISPKQLRIFTRGAAWRGELPPPAVAVDSTNASLEVLRNYLKAVLPPVPSGHPPGVAPASRSI